MALMAKISGQPAVMWGDAIIDFGSYLPPEKGASAWPRLCFSPRKPALPLYLLTGTSSYLEFLSKLGKHTAKWACMHIKRLSDVDAAALKDLVRTVLADMKMRYPS